MKWSEEEVAYLVSHYSSEPCRVTAAALGREANSISAKGHRLGLVKDAEYVRRARCENAKLARAAFDARIEESLAKVKAASKALARRERIRYLYGLTPLTKWQTPLGQSRAKINYRGGLRHAGMWEFADAMGDIYYPDGMKIAPKRLKTAAKYGLKLRPLSEYRGNYKTRGKKPFVAPTNNELDYDI